MIQRISCSALHSIPATYVEHLEYRILDMAAAKIIGAKSPTWVKALQMGIGAIVIGTAPLVYGIRPVVTEILGKVKTMKPVVSS